MTIDTIKLLKKLISIPSPFFHEEEISEFLFNQLQEMGFSAYRQEVKRTAKIDGLMKDLVHHNILGEKGDGKKSILLYAHMDTVPPVMAWRDMGLDPYVPVEKDGRLIGLGSDDMKAGIVAILKAVEDIKPCGYKIKVAFGVDEECDSAGAYILLKSDFVRDCVACIVPEVGTGRTPARPGKLILGRHGGCRVGVRIKGKAAHASTPEHAVNPIKYALKLIEDIEKIDTGDDPHLPPGNVSTTYINSEIGGLSSPEECMVRFAFLYSIPQTSATIYKQIEEILSRENSKYSGEAKTDSFPFFMLIDPRKLSEEDRKKFHFRKTPFNDPYKIDKSNPLVISAKFAVREVLNMDPEICYGKSNADENYFAMLMPVIVIPPVGGNEHQAGEYVEIDSVDATAGVIKRTITKYFKSES